MRGRGGTAQRGAAQPNRGGAGGLPARGNIIRPAMGAGRGGPMNQGQFVGAMNVMKDLIQEYDDLSICNLKDLQAKYSVAEIGRKIYQGIVTNNYQLFSQFISILELELQNLINQEKLKEASGSSSDDDDEQYYYEEDRKFECRIKLEERKTIKDARQYIEELSNITGKEGLPIIHLAAVAAAKGQDTGYLQRVLDLGFFIYQEDSHHLYPALHLAQIQDDVLFAKCYAMFKERGFDPSKNRKDENGQKQGSSTFLERFF